MERIYKYITLPLIILMAISCINDELTSDIPSAESGDEVKFGLSLQNPDTKTVYGDEYYEYTDSENKQQFALPIYWVDGDKVQIFSPQCLTGRRSAEYKVILPNDQDDKGNPTPPYYADDLVRTGEYGVQWGDSETADFYSLYPSGNYTLSESGVQANGITINYNQNIIVNGDNVKSDMEDCLMYAATKGVKKGDIVNLNYRPIATVVYVTISVAANSDPTPDEFTIQSITLKANKDQNIAGVFSLNIEDGTFGEFVQGKASNVIQAQIHSAQTGGYHILKNEQYVEIPLFLAPCKNLDVNGWKLTVVANNVEYTKTLTGFEKPLTPGQIHKVVLPQLAPDAQEWNPGSWMERIPRNVYLSEVSIPGSWNTKNTDYQKDTSIAYQYGLGVRGFHLDTRWRTDDKSSNTLGYLEGSINGLSVAGGAASDNYASRTGARVVSGNARTFDQYLKDITDNIVDANGQPKEEYMVVMCTFAQDSYDYKDADGGNWVTEISKACAANDYVYDSKKLTQNTLIGDVVGKVIVIVNLEGAVTNVPSNSKCLFVNLPLTLTRDLFTTSLTEKNSGTIYKATNTTNVVDSGLDMYHTQAQISLKNESDASGQSRDNVMSRGFAPTLNERITVANNILNWSRDNYQTENYSHDKWVYLGLGGYYSKCDVVEAFGYVISATWDEVKGSNATVAGDFNPWINSKVIEMGTIPSGQTQKIPYYPVGIVMMNFVNDYSTVVQNILLLNNKYRLQYDPNKPSDYTPNLLSASEYGSSATHGGNAISLD